MKKMKDLPAHDRPREKIAQKGVQALTDGELIEAIIGRGMPNRDVRAIARDIDLLIRDPAREIRYEDLLEIEGSGPTRAAQILACLELGRRRYRPSDAVKIRTPEDILPIVSSYRDKPQEYFICISLSGAGEVIQNRVVTIGILNHSLVPTPVKCLPGRLRTVPPRSSACTTTRQDRLRQARRISQSPGSSRKQEHFWAYSSSTILLSQGPASPA